MEYIRCKDTVMRSAITAKQRLAITLYFLASTAEYRTIANLFGVSRSFLCLCVRDVSKAITSKLSHVVSFPHGDELVQIINDYEQRYDGVFQCVLEQSTGHTFLLLHHPNVTQNM